MEIENQFSVIRVMLASASLADRLVIRLRLPSWFVAGPVGADTMAYFLGLAVAIG
jgi:hypothetical protein